MADWSGGHIEPPGLSCKYFDVGLARVNAYGNIDIF